MAEMKSKMYKKYIEKLKNGKRIRIKYNVKNHDYCEDGWWSEELWCYDSELDLFKCYYPVSSYEKDFFTTHTHNETENFLREVVRDSDDKYGDATVTDIIAEDCCATVSSFPIRETVLEKIKSMSDEDLKKIMLL